MTSTVAAALAALPDTRHEDWRYTDLAPLKARTWIEEKGSGPFSLTFENAEPVTLAVPLGGRANGASLVTHRIALRAGQQATLVLHECHPDDTEARDDPTLVLHNLDIDLAANASLTLYRIQQPGAATNLISRLDARVGRDARFTCIGLYAGGALTRNDLNVALDAPGAQAELHGVIAPAAGQHLDVHTRLDHRAPHGRSRETFRCLVPAKARAIFNGKVIVQPGAQKTDSEQHVDSLLLAPGAEVNAKPELEIYADDVKCAHGATCGQLDETALYYLRSRGLDLPTARRLLLTTFAYEVLQGIAYEPARALAESALRARLP